MDIKPLVLENAVHLSPLLLSAAQGGQQLCQVLKTVTIDDEEMPRGNSYR